MTLQNKVLPTGEIVADSARGMFTGNRGCLHDDQQRLGQARWKGKAWISCALHYKGRQRQIMAPRRWTELFFLDEAVAMAAGHRPCALCRSAAYAAFRRAWRGQLPDMVPEMVPDMAPGLAPGLAGPISASEMDSALHHARVAPNRDQRRYEADAAGLPDGCFILWQGQAHLLWGDQMLSYSPSGYALPVQRPSCHVTVLTPAPMVGVLRAGYRPVTNFSESVAMAFAS